VRILDKLRDDGRITAPQYESFYHQAKRTGERVEEAILESGAVGEGELMKMVAAMYQTRFVSTERLSKADIERATLEMVPRRLAERLQCVPILYDRRAQTLSVVAYDLDEDIGKQIQVAATGAREVRVFVARPAAVRAALRRFYGGDPHAFASIGSGAGGLGLDAFDRGHEAMGRGSAGGRADALDLDFDDRTPAMGVAPGGMSGGLPGGGIGGIGGIGGLDALGGLGAAPPAPMAYAQPAAAPARPAPPELRIEMPKFEVAPDFESFLETMSVLVTLLDASRAELRGHGSHVARICKQIAEKVSLSPNERNAVMIAAYLHDIGKASTYHLTALNVSRFDGHRLQAQRSYLAPVRMFESARLPEGAIQILTHLFERYDGQGFPDRQAGKDIAIGARIVAMVETYADLTVNPKNPYRRTLTPKEAVDVMRQLSSTLFDPVLVDVLRQTVIGESAGKSDAKTRVLVIDPDREETTMLELRLEEAGHQVVIARDRTDAEGAVAQHRFDLILAELEIGTEDGFAICAGLRADPKVKDVPYVFLTRKADGETVARGFELGAADFLPKPASAAVVAAKVTQLIEAGARKRSGGLAGALRDMALPDVLQALGNGRKTGLLRISSGGQSGEIQFLEGQIANASFGSKAREDAVYAMLALKDGDFVLDPAFKPKDRVMQASIEALLLEGMRRIDEGI
jgi:response regulator RpfG family c-di-GMP phosphodiesterase